MTANKMMFSVAAVSAAATLSDALDANDEQRIRDAHAELKARLAELEEMAAHKRSVSAIAYAREHIADDDLEIDDNPLVSRSESGTFVQAWVHVPDPDPDQDDAPGIG